MKKVVFGIAAALLVFGLVLAACSGDDGNDDTTGFTLTVTDLPPVAQGKVYGASLMDPLSPTTPVAVGSPVGNNGFSFYFPLSGSPYPDSNRPFNTPGTYILFIALTNFSNPTDYEATYLYTKNNGTVTYSSSNKPITVQWSDFARQ
jgi:hypothetical protein